MLQRVEGEKVKYQVLVPAETVRRIRVMAQDQEKFQSKYVVDLVDEAWDRRAADE